MGEFWVCFTWRWPTFGPPCIPLATRYSHTVASQTIKFVTQGLIGHEGSATFPHFLRAGGGARRRVSPFTPAPRRAHVSIRIVSLLCQRTWMDPHFNQVRESCEVTDTFWKCVFFTPSWPFAHNEQKGSKSRQLSSCLAVFQRVPNLKIPTFFDRHCRKSQNCALLLEIINGWSVSYVCSH